MKKKKKTLCEKCKCKNCKEQRKVYSNLYYLSAMIEGSRMINEALTDAIIGDKDKEENNAVGFT